MRFLQSVVLLCVIVIVSSGCSSHKLVGRPHLRTADRDVADPSPDVYERLGDTVRVHAVMSELAYRNYSGRDPLPNQVRHIPGEKPKESRAKKQRAERWETLAKWLVEEQKWEFIGHNKYRCGNSGGGDEGGKDKVEQNLEFDVWIKRSQEPPQVVLAFRGTDNGDRGDWVANLRGVLPFYRDQDQYAKLHELEVKREVERACKSAGSGAIVTTTGHSLGGGLAQHLFYASQLWPINYVTTAIVFDSSPMTGWYQFGPEEDRAKAIANFYASLAAVSRRWQFPEVMALQYGFGTIRVNERGEVLSYLRSLFRTVQAEETYISNLNFDFEDGNTISQHSMSNLAYNLLHFPKPAPAFFIAQEEDVVKITDDNRLGVTIADAEGYDASFN